MISGRFKTFVEVAAVFAVFFLFGAWKVPDVNEAHYIGKAIHYWNPDWIPNDPFLESRDAHWTFYMVFGWLSFFCSPTTMAWIGRITAWTLLAWSWQRLSFALVPVRWAAIPTALALAYYIEAFNMAGEWLIGGIEGKSLAYPFVFFALEAMLRRRWNRVGIFLGIASALHVLVGGWATLIIGVIFFTTFSRAAWKDGSRHFPWVGLIVGGLLALCGLIPVLMLDAGTSPSILHESHQIYVFKRLPHHLVPYLIKDSLILRFALLTVIWILLCRQGGKRQRMFNAFVWGTLGIAAVGFILAYSKDQKLSAEILRFYWFRLSDIAVPMGVAIGAVRWGLKLLALQSRNRKIAQSYDCGSAQVLSIIAIITAIYFATTYLCFGWFKMTPDASVPWAMTLLICLGVFSAFRAKAAKSSPSAAVCRPPSAVLFYIAIAFYAPLTALPKCADLRIYSGQCRTDPVGPMGKRAIGEWKDMSQWIQENTSKEDKFWVPRDGHTFKWYAQRADIGTWKNLPQDAESIVQWYKSMDELYVYKDAEGKRAEDRLLTTLLNSKTEAEIAALQQKYGFTYILCAQSYEMLKHATLEMVYENDVYCLYRVLR
ncbi:MAG: hypothetical protein LBI05_04295 [Planctomycetaceae bacterium]|nr:hypothetical protein [Planctomycetaceae bacterium]